MINVGPAVQNKFLSDSVDKQVRLEFETNTDLSEVNWYFGNNPPGLAVTWNNHTFTVGTGFASHEKLYDLKPYVEFDYFDRVKWTNVSFDIAFYLNGETLPDTVDLGFKYTYKRADGTTGQVANFEHVQVSSLIRTLESDVKYRTACIRGLHLKENNYGEVMYLDEITIRFPVQTGWTSGQTFTINKVIFGGLQVDLSNDSSELPYPINFTRYVQQGTYRDHIVDDGPLIPDIYNEDIQLESLSLTESLCSQDNLKFGCCEAAHFEIGIVGHHDKFFNKIIKPYICCWKKTDPDYDARGDVPLGVFRIKDVKQEYMYDFDKKTLTCYDKMTDLDISVGDWLTKYMWVWDSGSKGSSYGPDYSKFGVEFARQMFPTFANLLKRLNLLSDNDFTQVLDTDSAISTGSYIYNYNYIWYDTPEYLSFVMCTQRVRTFSWNDGAGHSSGAPDGIRVVLHPWDNKTDEEIWSAYIAAHSIWSDLKTDEHHHGFPSSASVLIKIKYEDEHEYGILADNGDYVYIGQNAIYAEVWVVCDIGRLFADDKAAGVTDSTTPGMVDNVKIYTWTMPKLFEELANPQARLVYYNYGTQELASFDSGCTGREAIRSLLEINGCFFHMNRYGKPEIIHATKAGLYPRNDLYPSEDLFPKGTDVPLMSMGRYISFERADYEVHNYGKIQIKTNAQVSGNEGKSICSYEYIGDPDYDNVYIIEDNIFYCSDGTVYEYGSQPEVDEMLRNMYNIIKNMKYVPHTTKAVGQPYIECGDRLRLLTKTGGAESFIFRRTLKGIHGLKDTYEAEGDEYNEALNTFDYVPYSPGS